MPKQNPDRGRILRASDVGYYHYCQRAWWLKSVKGYDLQNRAALDAGIAHHAAHAATIEHSRRLRRLAFVLLGIALIVIMVAIFLPRL